MKKNGQLLILAASLLGLAFALARLRRPAPLPPEAPLAPAPAPEVVKEKVEAPPKGRKGEVRLEKLDIQLTKEAAAAKSLEAMEKSAIAGVKGDMRSSPGQRKAKLADIKTDFALERKKLKKFPKNAAKDQADMAKDVKLMRARRRAAPAVSTSAVSESLSR